jgi:cAMP-dependent protein kinase regulator
VRNDFWELMFVFFLFVSEPAVNRFASRRKSVFAETYDPEEDEEEGARAIFPKTDDQRTRLCDSVKNILLFRSLDKEQVGFQRFYLI